MKTLIKFLSITPILFFTTSANAQVYKNPNGKADTVSFSETRQGKINKYNDLKNRESKFIQDTINPFWIDLCNTYNITYNKIKNKNLKTAATKIEYDAISHTLKMFRSKADIENLNMNKAKEIETINVLRFRNAGEVGGDVREMDIFFVSDDYVNTINKVVGNTLVDQEIMIKSDYRNDRLDFDFSPFLLPKLNAFKKTLEETDFLDYYMKYSGKFSDILDKVK